MKSSKSHYTIRETPTPQAFASPKAAITSPTSQDSLKLPPITWEQFTLLKAEIDRLTSLCSMLTEKNKAMQLKRDQYSDLEAQNACLRKEILLLRENDGLVADLESINRELTEENERISEELIVRTEEAEEWKFRYDSLEKNISQREVISAQNASYHSELAKLKEQLADYKSSESQVTKLRSQVQVLTDEKERLSSLLAKKEDRELELRSQLEQAKSVRVARETKESSGMVWLVDREKEKMVSEYNVKISRLQEEVAGIKELKSALHLASVENQRLAVTLEEKVREIDALKSKKLSSVKIEREVNVSVQEKNKLEASALNAYAQEKTRVEVLEAVLAEKSAAYNHEVSLYVQEKARLEGILAEKSKSFDVLKFQLGELENSSTNLIELREKLAVMSAENERLARIVGEKQTAIETLDKKVIESQSRHTVVVEKEIKSIVQDRTAVDSEIVRLEKELKLSSENVSQLEEKIALLLVQNRQLVQEKEILNVSFSAEIKELEILKAKLSEINILASQVKILEEEKKEKMKLVDKEQRESKQALYEREKTIKELRAQTLVYEQKVSVLNEYKEKLLQMTFENEKLRVVLFEKAREIDTLKIEVSSLVTANKDFKTTIEDGKRLNIVLTEKLTEITSIKSKLVQLENENVVAMELNEKLSANNAKNDKLVLALNQKLDETEKLRARSSLLSETEGKLKLALKERDEFVSLYKLQGQEIERCRDRIIWLESHVVELEQKVRNEVKEKEKVNIVIEKVENIEKVEVQKLELNNTITDLKLKLQLSNQENEQLSVVIAKKENEINELKLKLSETAKESEVRIKEVEFKVKEVESVNVQLNKITRNAKETESLSERTAFNVQYKEKIALVEKEKLALQQAITEKEQLIQELNEQTDADIHNLETKLSSMTAENQRLVQTLIEKSNEIEQLKAKLLSHAEVEKTFRAEQNKLKAIIADKEQVIKNLESKAISVQSELDANSKVTMLNSESKWLNGLVIERLSKQNTAEQELATANADRNRLGLEIAERKSEISLMKAKMSELEAQVNTIPELKGKIGSLTSEKEWLEAVLAEKVKMLEELQNKYATLEHLYLHVRGQIKKPEPNDKKGQEIVRAYEKVEYNLGLYGRAKALKKNVSVASILMQPDSSQSPTLAAMTASLTKTMIGPMTTKSASSATLTFPGKLF